MYKGRSEKGVELRLHFQSQMEDGQIIEPDSRPTLDIWYQGTKIMAGLQCFPEERYNSVGFFVSPTFLYNLNPGTYTCVFRWTIGGFYGVSLSYFEVVIGGNNNGAIIAMTYFDTPQGRFLVYQTDASLTRVGKNPQ